MHAGPLGHSPSAAHSAVGHCSGVSGVHSGATQTPPRHSVAAASLAAGQDTPRQLRVSTTVTAVPPRTSTTTVRRSDSAPGPESVTVTRCWPWGTSKAAIRVPAIRSSPSAKSAVALASATVVVARVTSSPGTRSVRSETTSTASDSQPIRQRHARTHHLLPMRRLPMPPKLPRALAWETAQPSFNRPLRSVACAHRSGGMPQDAAPGVTTWPPGTAAASYG